MMTEAYGFSVIAVIAALCYCIIRATTMRPRVLLAALAVGLFVLGFVSARAVFHADEGWLRVGTAQPPPEPIGALSGETVPLIASSSSNLGVRAGGKIGIEVYDFADAATQNRQSVIVKRGASVQISGWAMDVDGGAPCRAFYAVIGKTKIGLPYGFARPDVATYFNNPGFTSVGFAGKFSTDRLSPGSYTLKLQCLAADGKAMLALPAQRALVVQ